MILCQGVGFNDRKYPSKIKGKNVREYKLWNAMLYRCYSPKALSRDKGYIDCTVSENFKSYSYFYEWCQEQIGFSSGFELDKDIIIKGNKLYSEDTCAFIPHEINSVLNSCKSARGELPVGIQKTKSGKYKARVCLSEGRVNCGLHKTCDDAFEAYKQEKERRIRILAYKYKDVIDCRVYNSLLSYSVEVGD